MASREFDEYQGRLASAARPSTPATLEERRAQIDESLGGAPITEGAALENLKIGGDGCISLRRQASQDQPILCYFHGGGYRMGSARAWSAFS